MLKCLVSVHDVGVASDRVVNAFAADSVSLLV